MTEVNGGGVGWVRFTVIHQKVLECLLTERDETSRNLIDELIDGSYVWRRPPDERGRGVRRGNQVSDFVRFVSNAVLNFPVSTVHGQRGNWAWDYRDVARQLVRTFEHGWVASVTEPLPIESQVLRAHLVIDPITGRITGQILTS